MLSTCVEEQHGLTIAQAGSDAKGQKLDDPRAQLGVDPSASPAEQIYVRRATSFEVGQHPRWYGALVGQDDLWEHRLNERVVARECDVREISAALAATDILYGPIVLV